MSFVVTSPVGLVSLEYLGRYQGKAIETSLLAGRCGIPIEGLFWAFEKLVKQVESKLNAWMEASKRAKGAFIIQTSYSEFMKERLTKNKELYVAPLLQWIELLEGTRCAAHHG